MKRNCAFSPYLLLGVVFDGVVQGDFLTGVGVLHRDRSFRVDGRRTLPFDFEVAEEKEFPIVRTKRFAVKPMSAEEAILQMNLLDHSFFVFRSSEDDSLSIVYKRKSGGGPGR